jgi:hypothetical protein
MKRPWRVLRGLAVAVAACACSGGDEDETVTMTYRAVARGLWEGDSLLLMVRGTDATTGLLLAGSDAAEVTTEEVRSSTKGPFHTSIERTSADGCEIVSGADGVVVDGGVAEIEVRCPSAVEAIQLSAAPGWAFDPLILQPQLPAEIESTAVTVQGPRLTQIKIDGRPVMAGEASPVRTLHAGANAIIVEVERDYRSRRYELRADRPGLASAPETIVPEPPIAFAYFGYGLAAGGDRVAVLDDSVSDGGDRVHIFTREASGWRREAMLTDLGDRFHQFSPWPAMALDGDTFAIGDPEVSENRGVVHVFRRTDGEWQREADLQAPSASPVDQFGRAVALSGDLLVAGAPRSDTALVPAPTGADFRDSGIVHVFRRGANGWEREASLKASNAGAGDQFGTQVAVYGNTIVVGAPGEDSRSTGVGATAADDDDAANSGAAYVFELDGGFWRQRAYLKSTRTQIDGILGWSIAVSDDAIAVSASGEEPTAAEDARGAIYLYRRSSDPAGWAVDGHATSRALAGSATFGCCATLFAGGRLVVAVPGDNNIADTSGAIRVYDRVGSEWLPRVLLKAPAPSAGGYLGAGLGVLGNRVIASAPGQAYITGDRATYEVGAFYSFELSTP